MTVIKSPCVPLHVNFSIWVPLYASDVCKEPHYPVYLDLGCSDIPEQQSNASTHYMLHGNREPGKTPKIFGNWPDFQNFCFGFTTRVSVIAKKEERQ